MWNFIKGIFTNHTRIENIEVDIKELKNDLKNLTNVFYEVKGDLSTVVKQVDLLFQNKRVELNGKWKKK